MTDLKGKFVLTTDGNTKPLFMKPDEWQQISSLLKRGTVPITTNKDTYTIFAVLEIAKGYEGKGISFSETGMMMLFSEEESGNG